MKRERGEEVGRERGRGWEGERGRVKGNANPSGAIERDREEGTYRKLSNARGGRWNKGTYCLGLASMN